MLIDKKVTESQLSSYGVVSAPDKLTGTAAENKAVFDRLIREIVGSSLNPVIEELAGGTGAQTIGAQVAGMAGDNVQTLLNGLKTLVDNRYTKSESDALLAAGTNDLVETIEIDLETGIFTITKKDGTASSIDTAMEKIALDVCLDGTDFVLTLADGSEQRVSLAAFIDTYTFPESDTIAFSVAGTGNQKQVSASVRGSSITLSMLAPEVTGAVETAAESAQTSAQAAQEAKTAAQAAEASAAQSKTQAQDAKTQAQAAATLAQSWAVGTTGTRAGEDENNSKYYAQRAQAFSENSANSAQGAASSAQAAQTQAQNAKDQADRAKSEADRASEIAGGDYATRTELAAKTDKVSGATSGNLAGLDANGNLTDSGKSAEDFAGRAELDGKADAGHTHTAEQVGADPSGSASAVQANLNTHTGNTTVHITASERTGWNGKAAAKSYTATLTAEGWSGTTAPYTQTASVTGIAEGDQPQIGPVYSATLATALLQQEAWNMVSKAVTAANSITFTCFTDKPATAIPVQIKVVK